MISKKQAEILKKKILAVVAVEARLREADRLGVRETIDTTTKDWQKAHNDLHLYIRRLTEPVPK